MALVKLIDYVTQRAYEKRDKILTNDFPNQGYKNDFT